MSRVPFHKSRLTGNGIVMNHYAPKFPRQPSIGAILLDTGKINAGDAARIIELQKRNGLKFGEAARILGLVEEQDIQKALSNQFDFPFLTADEQGFSRELVAAYQPFSAQVEALRVVRSQLMLRWLSDHKAVAVTGSARQEGRSYIAANLAIVFSQLGERILLIDADLRQPRQHTLFNLSGQYGLSDILAGRSDLSAISRIPAFRDLSILPAGTIAPNPGELLSRGFKPLLAELKTQFEVILIDTPPANQAIDHQVIAASCGGGLIVARQHTGKINELKRLTHSLRETGSHVIGVVVNNFRM